MALGLRGSVTVIAAGTRVGGTLEADGDLVIAGVVAGDIHCQGTVTVEAGARIGTGGTAVVRGRDIVLAGSFTGCLKASTSVRLLASAELRGDIESPRVAIDDGALFEGGIRMPRPASRPAATQVDVTPPTTVAAPKAAPPPAAPPPAPAKAAPPAKPAAPRAIPELPTLGRRRITRITDHGTTGRRS
jgi:cytoskeletal protein CcmA (bactofilin family)